MAIYSLNISNVSRGAGSSSLATLSYISGEKIYDERLGKTYNYGRKQRIMKVGVLLPEGAPPEFVNPETMFNSIEDCDRAKNARTAKKIMIALPRELDLDQQTKLVERYIKVTLASHGYAAVYAIHTDADNHNPHVHILIPNRAINPDTSKWQPKRVKDYVRDENGNRVPVLDRKTGKQKVDKRNRKQWKRIDISRNELDKKETLVRLRKIWTKECNRYLTKDQQIDDRSNEERGIEEIPTIHEGYAARAIEQRGGVSVKCQENREIHKTNKLFETLRLLREKIEKEKIYERISRLLTGDHAESRGATGREQDVEDETLLERLNNQQVEREQRYAQLRQSDAHAAATAAERRIAESKRADRDAERERQAAARSAEDAARKRDRKRAVERAEEQRKRNEERSRSEFERSRDDEIEI